MLVNKAVQLAVLAVVLWTARTDAASSAFRLCGRKLGEVMSRICHVYNSPDWDVPTVVEQPASLVRRRRQTGGIADECCTRGCTFDQLSEYCSVSADDFEVIDESHLIENRSAEVKTESVAAAAPRVLGKETSQVGAKETRAREAGRPANTRREVGDMGSARSGGYGRARRGRRCWCRRKRRSGRRRASLMGNMDMVRNVVRGAPVVGTVSPLLTWGRTLNTDLPQTDRDRYAYVAVYST